jgi:hypothetical protein
MTSEWLGEMLKGDSADMCAAKILAHADGGTSKDPHRCERIFSSQLRSRSVTLKDRSKKIQFIQGAHSLHKS